MNKIKTLGVMLDCSRNAVIKSEIGYNALKLYTEDSKSKIQGYNRSL